jgi:hypothetical protein
MLAPFTLKMGRSVMTSDKNNSILVSLPFYKIPEVLIQV